MARRWSLVSWRLGLAASSAVLALTLSACDAGNAPEPKASPATVEQVADHKPEPKAPASVAQAAPTPTPIAAQQQPATSGSQATPQRIMPKKFEVATVEPPTFDAKRVNPNQLAHGVFTIKNNTSAPLEIDRIHITCNCTRAKARSEIVPPNGEAIVDVYIDLRGDVGPFEKQAHVYFKGFPNSPADMRLIGEFQFPIAADPARLRVDSRYKTGAVKLVSLDHPFKVLSVNGQPPRITQRVPEDGDQFMECTIVYDLRDLPQIPAALCIVTDHPDAEVLPLRILGALTAQHEREYVRRLQEIALSRRFLNLGVLEPGKPAHFDMTVFRKVENHGQPIEAFFGRSDLTANVTLLTEEDNASMFPKAQRIEFDVVSSITTPGEVFLTPIYMKFTPAAGGNPIVQRVWAAGIMAGEHVPTAEPLVAENGNIQ
ncbi:MAG: DUF1573 domain-containing protein [Phycisphaerales bacterium]|nr:DUF1573 domain-containing protein [Phycisphaerales bacterium]